MIGKLLLASAAALSVLTLAVAEDFAITNAKVWTGSDAGTLENATIFVSDGEIAGLGVNFAAPSGTPLIDAGGNWVTPGIFSAFTQMGIVEVGAEDSTNDTNASGSNFSVALRASDGFNPAATPVAVTRIEGVTRVAVAPSTGSSLFAGQGFIADTSGAPGSVTQDQAFVYMNLDEGGAALAGGSRPAAWAALRGAFADARGYPARFMAHNEGDTLTRTDAQAFGPAVRGQQLMLISAHRASDLRKVIQLKAENPSVRVAIIGAAEGWMVADELAAANIPVIIDPFDNLPGSFSQLGATAENAKRLMAARVPTAFAHLSNPGHQGRLILQSAGNAVANGVSHDDALAAITVVPALIFGLDEYGSIERGNAADLVIWDGDPLEVTSAPTAIYIDGTVQSLESRQTKLRDRYLELDRTEKPLAYKR